MSANLRRSGIDTQDKVRIDKTIGILVDITGACERIFKSPVPLVYTRHSSRFLTAFLILMPFALWESAGAYWNHWISIPEAYALSFFLFGIEEIGMQVTWQNSRPLLDDLTPFAAMCVLPTGAARRT